MSQYRLLRHPNVAEDLRNIVDLIADYAGPGIALRKLDDIERTIRGLSQQPHIGSLRNEIVEGLRAIPTADKGVVCFIVDDEKREVLILAIGYAGSDWSRLTQNRTRA